MATKTPDAEGTPAAPPKSKKMLILIVVGVLVLALGGGGAWFFMSKKNADAEEGGDEEAATAHHAPEKSGPPAYLPLDNMVVNLADPGGDRVAQIGVTLELSDAGRTEAVKAYMPSIRSEVLMLISQRTAEELLKREGKEQLATDIMTEASKHFESSGGKKGKKGKKAEDANPIRGVLFSSFIVQ